jgi:hypothetical protein
MDWRDKRQVRLELIRQQLWMPVQPQPDEPDQRCADDHRMAFPRGVVLGTDLTTNAPVIFPDDARTAHFAIVGGTRMGKSSLIETMALADMREGRGLCLIDPHGRLYDRLLRFVPPERTDDVIAIDISDEDHCLGLNLYHCPTPGKQARLARQAGQTTGIFQKLWPDAWGPRVDQVTRTSAYTFLEHPGAAVDGRRLPYTMAEIPVLLRQKAFRHSLVQTLTNVPVRQFWELQYDQWGRDEVANTESTLNKIGAFLENPLIYRIVGQSESTIDVRLAMDTAKIILVKLAVGSVGDPVVSLVGALIIAHILNAALSREDAPVDAEVTPFGLYIDEAARYSTPDLAAILTDTGKYGLSTVAAVQALQQLDEQTRTATSQVGALAVFRAGPEEADVLAGYFDTTPGQGPEIGQKPKQAVTPDPVSSLLHSGHEDEDVRDFVSWYLQPMANWANDLPAPSSDNPDGGFVIVRRGERTYTASRSDLQDALRRFGQYFTEIMERHYEPRDSSSFRLVREIAHKLSGYIGFDDREFTKARLLVYLSNRWEKGMDPREARAQLFSSFPPPPDVGYGSDEAVKEQRNREYRDKVENQRQAEFEALGGFLLSLMRAVDVLAENPILVNTGQYEPVYAQQTHQDRRNEIAKELVTLPRRTARCRIDVEGEPQEYLLRPAYIGEPELTPERERLVQDMIERSQRDYCRPRQVVEEEIRRRQLMVPQAPSRGPGTSTPKDSAPPPPAAPSLEIDEPATEPPDDPWAGISEPL